MFRLVPLAGEGLVGFGEMGIGSEGRDEGLGWQRETARRRGHTSMSVRTALDLALADHIEKTDPGDGVVVGVGVTLVPDVANRDQEGLLRIRGGLGTKLIVNLNPALLRPVSQVLTRNCWDIVRTKRARSSSQATSDQPLSPSRATKTARFELRVFTADASDAFRYGNS